MGGGGRISLTARERGGSGGGGEALRLVGPALPPELVFKCPSGTVQRGIISVVQVFSSLFIQPPFLLVERTRHFSLGNVALRYLQQKLHKGGWDGVLVPLPPSPISANVTFLLREANDPI